MAEGEMQDGMPRMDDTSDEEMEWDEVEVAQPSSAGEEVAAVMNEEDKAAQAALHIVDVIPEINDIAPVSVKIQRSKPKKKDKKRTASSAVEKAIRHTTHQAHTLALLCGGLIRNRLLNDALLKARLLSMVPLRLSNAFSAYSVSTHPNERDRSRMFDNAMRDLVSWWWQAFEVDNSLEGVRLRTWAEAEAMYTADPPAVSTSSVAPLKTRAKDKWKKPFDPFTDLLESGEPVHSSKSLMKRTVLQKGSRDMSAQLFTSLCRALDIPARLVFSLQPVTWRGAGGGGKAVDKDTDDECADTESSATAGTTPSRGRRTRPAKPTSVAAQSAAASKKRKRGDLATVALKNAQSLKNRALGGVTLPAAETDGGQDEYDGEFEEVPIPSGSGSASQPLSLSDSERDSATRTSWMSNPTGKVSKIAPAVRLRKSRPALSQGRHWTKSPSPGPEEMNRPPVWWAEVYSRPGKEWYAVDVTRKKIRCKNIMEPAKSNPENKMVYVVAYEEDHFLRDVTAKYAHSYGGTTVKSRLQTRGVDWFTDVISPLRRPYKLTRDVKEDEEIERAQITEPMPTTMTGFKDHPNYALERHLKREETLYPPRQLGTFRGEPVYPRSAVVPLKSSENWLREGKRIKGGEQPLKTVKARAVTVNKRREQEAAKLDGNEEGIMQGLYAEWQVELLIPPPIEDGHIPRNSYGNIDLFAPHMLPKGAAHLPYKGIAKIARKLNVSYAEAVVGFEFRQRRAVPVTSGIVIPEEDREFVWDAYWESEEAAQEKELTKMQERALKRWKKLVLGLKIRQRLQEEYRQKGVGIQGHAARLIDGPSELRDPGPDATAQDLPPADLKTQDEIQELYTDHRVNTLSMPDPSKPSQHNVRMRQEVDSDTEMDDQNPAKKSDVEEVHKADAIVSTEAMTDGVKMARRKRAAPSGTGPVPSIPTVSGAVVSNSSTPASAGRHTRHAKSPYVQSKGKRTVSIAVPRPAARPKRTSAAIGEARRRAGELDKLHKF